MRTAEERLLEDAAAAVSTRRWVTWGLGIVLVLIVFLSGFILCWRLVSAKVSLSQAKNTKKIQIEEARGRADAASLLAEAEVERAKGVAQANEIIANSLTDEYIRWLYVDQLDQTEGTIIYVPTEAGLPILESQRLNPGVTVED